MAAVKVLETTLPRTATPRAAPACWMVLLRADPTPACSGGMAPISAETAAGMARPPPAPSTNRAAPRTANPSSGETAASVANPAAMTTRPTAARRRLPILFPMVAPRVLKVSEATAIGRKARPACAGEYPSTNCRYWVSTSSSPPTPTWTRVSERLPPLKLRARNSPRGTIGDGMRVSQRTNPARPSTATASATRVFGWVRPCRGSSMIIHTSAVIPTVDSTAPSGSDRCHGPLDSGISTVAATIARAATGTLSRNTEPHPDQAISVPPRTGPPTRPTMAAALQAVIALRRSVGSKTVIRIDSVLGSTRAPPAPITARAAISWSGLAANVAASEAAPKSASPRSMILRRPNRSPRLPAVSRRPAKTRM